MLFYYVISVIHANLVSALKRNIYVFKICEISELNPVRALFEIKQQTFFGPSITLKGHHFAKILHQNMMNFGILVRFHPGFQWCSCCSVFSFTVSCFCRFIVGLFVISLLINHYVICPYRFMDVLLPDWYLHTIITQAAIFLLKINRPIHYKLSRLYDILGKTFCVVVFSYMACVELSQR